MQSIFQLVEVTKKNTRKIRQQHKVIAEFQRLHPWLVKDALQELRINQPTDSKIPTFDEVVEFNKSLLIDSLSKVYRQVNKIDAEVVPVFYYVIRKGFYQNQLRKNFVLGDVDDRGYLVSGSDLVIDSVAINRYDFLGTYFSVNN